MTAFNEPYTSTNHATFKLYRGLGYVKLIDAHGSDERVIEAARMSTDAGFRGWGPTPEGKEGDEKLLRYLWKNKHATPFEMAHLVFEIQAPIFVARQVFRHRLFSYNELSARYTALEDNAWLPELDDVRLQNVEGNKQGSTATSTLNAEHFIRQVTESYKASFAVYEKLVAAGYAREQARAVVPLGTFTRWRQGGNLRLWLDFLSKRLPENAQAETRQMASALVGAIAFRHPRTFGLFMESTGLVST